MISFKIGAPREKLQATCNFNHTDPKSAWPPFKAEVWQYIAFYRQQHIKEQEIKKQNI